jgi:hypothetical protein
VFGIEIVGVALLISFLDKVISTLNIMYLCILISTSGSFF